jgi:hypothetical protein
VCAPPAIHGCEDDLASAGRQPSLKWRPPKPQDLGKTSQWRKRIGRSWVTSDRSLLSSDTNVAIHDANQP